MIKVHESAARRVPGIVCDHCGRALMFGTDLAPGEALTDDDRSGMRQAAGRRDGWVYLMGATPESPAELDLCPLCFAKAAEVVDPAAN